MKKHQNRIFPSCTCFLLKLYFSVSNEDLLKEKMNKKKKLNIKVLRLTPALLIFTFKKK